MTNLLERAISTDDGDLAAQIIQDALGIESDEVAFMCKIWYSISQTVSDLGSIYDRSIRTFAVKPRAFDAPVSGFGA